MKLKKEFSDFYSSIRIDAESNVLKEKREVLSGDIKDNLPSILSDHDISLNKSDIRMIDQGSYKYSTTIKADVVDRDVAVMIPLDISECDDPRKIKGYLRDSIKIPSRTVSIKEPCIRASYLDKGEEWLHIDLPLYAKHNDMVYLARGKEFSNTYLWEQADPEGLNDYLCGEINGNDQLRRVICFIKKWKNESYKSADSDHMIPPSIGLTLMACDCFVAQTEDDEEYDLLALQKTMKKILDRFSVTKDADGKIISADIACILPVTPWTDVFQKMRDSSDTYIPAFYTKLSKAVDNLTNAVNVQSDHDAAEYVQKVLGDDFDVPPKAVAAYVTQNKREHSFG